MAGDKDARLDGLAAHEQDPRLHRLVFLTDGVLRSRLPFSL